MFPGVAQFAFDGLEHSLHCFAARKSGRTDKLTPRMMITLSTVWGDYLCVKCIHRFSASKMARSRNSCDHCSKAHHHKTHHVSTYSYLVRHESINHHTTHTENKPYHSGAHDRVIPTRREGDIITQPQLTTHECRGIGDINTRLVDSVYRAGSSFGRRSFPDTIISLTLLINANSTHIKQHASPHKRGFMV